MFIKLNEAGLEVRDALFEAAESQKDLVEMVTPTNVGEEKEKWLEFARKGDFSYIPSFVYDKELLETNSMLFSKFNDYCSKSALKELDKRSGLSLRMLRARVNELKATSEMAQGILTQDDDETRIAAIQKFGKVSSRVYCMAQQQSFALQKGGGKSFGKAELQPNEIDVLESRQFNAGEIRQWFQWAVDEYGLDFEAIIDEGTTAIDVRDRGKVIAIPADRKVSGRKLITLLRHEIECHARDSANGNALFGGLGGGIMRCDDDVVYEGHAMWEEAQLELQLFGSCASLPLPWYTLALNSAALRLPVKNTAGWIFDQRFRAIRCTMSDVEKAKAKALNLTWTTLYRTLFRGRTQPINNGYYFPKDKAYLEGFLYAQKLATEGKTHWLSVGTISIKELETAMMLFPYFSEKDLPYQDKHLAEKLAYMLLTEAGL